MSGQFFTSDLEEKSQRRLSIESMTSPIEYGSASSGPKNDSWHQQGMQSAPSPVEYSTGSPDLEDRSWRRQSVQSIPSPVEYESGFSPDPEDKLRHQLNVLSIPSPTEYRSSLSRNHLHTRSSRSTDPRTNWLNAISGSYRPITVWMACCYHRSEVKDLLHELQYEMPRFLRRIHGYLQVPRFKDWYMQFVGALTQLDEGYTEIIDWLATEHKDHKCGGWVHPDLQHQKELYIKRLVVYNHYRKVFRDCWKEFMDYEGSFEGIPKIYKRKIKRRNSIGGHEKPRSTLLMKRMQFEVILRDHIVRMEEYITNSLVDTHEFYDEALLFKWFVEDVAQINERTAKKYKKQGMRYPFPDWKMKDPNDPRCLFWYATAPAKPVAVWDEDEDLCRYFP